MNCPQCQTANAPDAAFCSGCGTRLAPAEASAARGAAPGYSAPEYGSAQYGSAQYGAPGAPGTPGAPGGYVPGAPGGYSTGGPGAPGTPGYTGSPMGQYAPGSVGALSSFKFDLRRLTVVDRVVGVATLIAMISIWLDWYTASVTMLGQTDSGSVSGTGYHGWLWIEFILALALLAYLVARAGFERLPFELPFAHTTVLIAATGLQLLLMIIAFFATPPTPGVSDLDAGEKVSITWGAGAFIGLLAALIAAGPVIVPAVRSYLETRKAGGSAQRY